MTDEIHLSRVQSEFAEHDYPVACDALAASCAGTTVLFADGEADLGEAITTARVRDVGRHLARCHWAGFVHGDPTPRNVRVSADRTWLIDFGLGYYTDDVEDYAMDLHVFEGAVGGTADEPARLIDAFEDAYGAAGDTAVLEQLREIERRGRYQ